MIDLVQFMAVSLLGIFGVMWLLVAWLQSDGNCVILGLVFILLACAISSPATNNTDCNKSYGQNAINRDNVCYVPATEKSK